MKKRIVLTLAASFGLAASAPITVPAAENTTRIERMVTQSADICPRGHIDGYTTQLTSVFMTQQPRAIEKLEQRGVTICIDERLSPMSRHQNDREAIRYLRSWDQFSLPAGSTYADRPHLFNTIVDTSRTTLWEQAGSLFSGMFDGSDAARKENNARRHGAALRAGQASQTQEGQVAVQARILTQTP